MHLKRRVADATDDTSPGIDGPTATFMEVNFHGTGIDIRCIVANNKNDSRIPPHTGTKANYSFFIDSVLQNGHYVHEAGTTGDAFLYTSVFSTTGLSDGPHTLKLLLNGGLGVDGSVLMLFDYAIVTSDTASPTVAGITTVPATKTSSSKPSTSRSSQSGTTGFGVSTTGVIQNPNLNNATSAQSAPVSSSSTSPALSSPAHKSNILAIVGSSGGGILVLILLLLFWLRRRRRRSRRPPTIFPFPSADGRHSRPILRSFLSLKKEKAKRSSHSFPSRNHDPDPPHMGAQSNSDSAMRDYVRTLQAEVELLRIRDQRRQMVAVQRISSPEPPPRYEDS